MPAPPRLPQSRDRASYYFSALKSRTYHDPLSRNSSLSIRDLAWSPPGNRIACAGTDKLIRVWNPEKPDIRNSTELKGHTQPAVAVAWNPNHSDLLVSCSPDHTLRTWDYRTKTAKASVNTGGENVALAYHPDGNTVAVAARDEKVYFVDLRMNAVAAAHKLPAVVHGLCFSHRGETLLLSCATGQVLLYDFPSLKGRYSVEAHASAALCLELDPRGVHLAVGGSDAVVGIWDTEEWVCLRTLRGMDAPVKRVSFSFDGQYICAASDEQGSHDIEISHVDTGEHVHTVQTNHPVTNVKWHPTRYALAYSGDPAGLKILTGMEK